MQASADSDWDRAIGDNLALDGRLSAERRQQWQDAVERVKAGAPRIRSLEAAHRVEFMRWANARHLSPAFTRLNAAATLPPPDQRIHLIRVEDLSWVMRDLGRPLPGDDDLDAFLADWNGIRDSRPLFGAFHDSVRSDLEAADWPHDLRDRLGLGHYPPEGEAEIPVVVMKIPVADVLAGLGSEEKALAFAAPTAIDGPSFNPYFYPTPSPSPAERISYGRVVDLRRRGERLMAELVFRPIAYRRDHVMKFGSIGKREAWDLQSLRDAHVALLRSRHFDLAEPGGAVHAAL
ncbi:hypothetical protein WV31_06870 [Magnetospirillum sp. ME-1]|uniref:hypothetical protein n=1 Tax=Magnetospirillum sp. ME-1 TaxID=1639348 RepID=UPI000A17C207|nr:hypothetical protein [Magnetospirillum sp. ME-1]ARJ65396.1 hypothetical protein WV31_06870 [Magnetospirillum sp. ME-1]